MYITLKIKTLDAQTHEFKLDNEITVREFKTLVATKTKINPDQQRIIYCGRVLADEKRLSEFDVDGKVLHVAERPPPILRRNSSTSVTSTVTSNEASGSRYRTSGNMRNSPFLRALDGMVVGTMAIPVNGMNNAQLGINPLQASSSFCMNRIAVARHMLECANNIAAYLEDPSRGLNNSSLDILARGRWTMESTVVEVGITAADLPQNQNIVEMVQGAVSAALRRNGNAVTVMQLPTVFGSNEVANSDTNMIDSIQDAIENSSATTNTSTETNSTATPTPTPTPTPSLSSLSSNNETGFQNTAAVIIEDLHEDSEDEDVAGVSTGTQTGSSTSTLTGPLPLPESNANANANGQENANEGTEDSIPSRHRTGTSVLAEVIVQWCDVQTRLAPFIHQYHDILRNEPTFNNVASRENAQRVFDRVSEAFHYLSHAQHAISDLMLDVSQPTPRYLTCRPILVEQSSYVSSNNYLSATAANAAAAALREHQHAASSSTATQTRSGAEGDIGDFSSSSSRRAGVTATVTSDVDASESTTPTPTPTPTSENANSDGLTSLNDSPTDIGDMPRSGGSNIRNTLVEDPMDEPPNFQAPTLNDDNPQMQMARLIQAVVNVAPVDTEFHVHINAPGVVSFGVPSSPPAAAGAPNASGRHMGSAATETTTATATSSTTTQPQQQRRIATPIRNRGGGDQARVNTATLPTTSTQTRSTSRPQLQIGSMPPGGWNGRFIPANMTSAFDRFLPCSSHHIRETDTTSNGASNNASTTTSARTFGSMTPSRTVRAPMMSTFRPIVNSTTSTSTATTSATSAMPPWSRMRPDLSHLRNFLVSMPPLTSTSRRGSNGNATNGTSRSSGAPITPADLFRRNLRNQLRSFVNQHIFEGGPINDVTIPLAINRAVRWFGDAMLCFLPQYEKPEYNSRDSVYNILRRTLPLLIDLFKSSQDCSPELFESRLKQICEQFIVRLYSVLHVCVGQDNAEMYWGQLMRLLLVPVRSNFRDEALSFLCVYLKPEIPANTDPTDAQQFIVLRRTEQPDVNQFVDADVDMLLNEIDPININNFRNPIDIRPRRSRRLPNVELGSEPWHSFFHNDWVPVISGDIRTQPERTTSEPSYSDAYISGMSAKRRKVIQSKSTPNVKAIVSHSIEMALQEVPDTITDTEENTTEEIVPPTMSSEVLESLATELAATPSCNDMVRTIVRERIDEDTDYKPQKFPQMTEYVNKQDKF